MSKTEKFSFKIFSIFLIKIFSLIKLKFLNKDFSKMKEHTIDNIFKYVIHKSIFIPIDNNRNHKRVFALMCNYIFDMEHGLALIFENEQFKEMGPQDIIL